ncbi:hypothetical protein BDU57DRAFT_509465 [Ampelomyces quisqualis]|uniref:Mitochondrial ribosomal protein L28-domain-containing protein n=1 Tax=Ampelomyces quisqualis TaxID=50730 RepID=A0A6A5R4T0_AMPQU|nr:hypothetical protein BDU57DRAFT_509465 [Ampelomyces quisqualis]
MNLSILRPIFRPFAKTNRIPSALQRNAQCPQQRIPTSTSPFSSTAQLQKRNKKGPVIDPRITSIRYHLYHPLTPRPLHFSRNRSLRHWTIHRAWMLFLRKRRAAEALELERQYMSMRAACEHLRLMDSNGNRVSEAEAGGQGADPGTLGVKGRDVGRLYRSAMIKRGVWGSVPIEYAKLQTDFPSQEGWNHEWTRN